MPKRLLTVKDNHVSINHWLKIRKKKKERKISNLLKGLKENCTQFR